MFLSEHTLQNIHSKSTKHRKQSPAPVVRFDWCRLTEARRLDLMADFELSNGHTRLAETLSNAAQAIREMAQ